jgi:hypothetical protein
MNLTDNSATLPNAAAQTLQRSFEGAGLLRRKQEYRYERLRRRMSWGGGAD